MQRAIVFDPSIGSFNKGDAIIYEAASTELRTYFPDLEIFRISIHQPLGKIHRALVGSTKTKIVAGSNVLSAVMHPFLRQSRWNLKLQDYSSVRGCIYMGVGWAGNDLRKNFLGQFFLKNYPSRVYPHSVRDSRTKRKLEDMGFQNVTNTGCPTMWKLDGYQHAGSIEKYPSVVTTVTDNTPDIDADTKFLNKLKKNFDKCYIWFQGCNDEEYFKSLRISGFNVIKGGLEDYTAFLKDAVGRTVYIGSRLHGGVRAMQIGLPALILAVDHRASDIADDTGLNVVNLADYGNSEELWVPALKKITVDTDSINRFIEGVRGSLND